MSARAVNSSIQRIVAGTSAMLALAFSASAASVTKVAVLNGAQEPGGVTTDASGCAVFEIDTEANTLAYRIAWSGITTETAAHIHGPADPGVNAAAVHTLPAGSPKVGGWTYPEANEADLLAGRYYVNIHSSDFPAGEIRGQIVDLVAELNGAQAKITTPATGYGLFNIDTCTNTLSYYIASGGLLGMEIAAHIHGYGVHEVPGGALHLLPEENPKIGAWTYPEASEQRILDGQTYVNIHTLSALGGEIRGQIVRLVAPIDEVQAGTSSPGHGCAMISIDRETDRLGYMVTHQLLTGPATAAHIHGYAGPVAPAGVVHGIGIASPSVGLWTYPAGNEADILAGLTYVNIHTAANPGGEIRGQIEFPAEPCAADVNCDFTVNVDDLVAVIVTWGTGNSNADINDDGVVNVDDLVAVIVSWGGC